MKEKVVLSMWAAEKSVLIKPRRILIEINWISVDDSEIQAGVKEARRCWLA